MVVVAGALLALQTHGAVVFDNGPLNGAAGPPFASAITDDWEGTDAFSVLGSYDLTKVTLGIWSRAGEEPVSLLWAIGSAPYASDIASGSSNLTNVFAIDRTDYHIWESEFSISGAVDAGDYWLTLYGGVSSGQNRGLDVDQNGTPGPAFNRNAKYNIPSTAIEGHSFQIHGERRGVPEPGSSVALLVLSIAVLHFLRQTKRTELT